MLTLSQRLGSFPIESRVESFPQCRQDFLLPPPINRGGFHGLREEKSGSKVGQKPASLPRFCSFFSPSLSPPFQPPIGAITSFSTTSSTTRSQHNPQLTTKLPSRLSLFSFQPFSLLLLAFLSPLQHFLLPPTTDSGHRHLSRSLLSHRPDILNTSETPKPGNFLLTALPPPSSSRPLHAEFISACSGRIINMALGRASSGPAQMAGLDPAWPHLKKTQKNSKKNLLKKI